MTGSFVLEAPEQGRCDAIGDMSMIHIKCERPYAHQAPMGFIATGEVRVRLQPKRAVEIRGMELNRDSGGSDMLSYLTGLKIDMNLDLSGQVREQPLDVALHFWGGYISVMVTPLRR